MLQPHPRLRSAPAAAETAARLGCTCSFDHFVQFYERDEFLAARVAEYAAQALAARGRFLLIATKPHRDLIAATLELAGVDVNEASAAERYIELDAAETLKRILRGNVPDAALFADEIGGYVHRLTANGAPLFAFGEMVVLLWERGLPDAALRLEELWDELGHKNVFKLFCAYPIRLFGSSSATRGFQRVCQTHGRVLPAESCRVPLDAGQELLRSIASLQQRALALEAEVAERKRVESALREREGELRRREAELRAFVETASQGLHWVNAEGIITWANAAELELLGYPSSEYIGRHIRAFHADQEALNDILTRLGRGEKLRDYETRLRCKDGTIKTVLIDSSALWDNGRFVHTQCFTRDVSEQRKLEQSMRHWTAIVESSDDAIISKNLDGTITACNPGAERLYGYTAAEMIGRSVTLLMPPDRVQEEQGILVRLQRGEKIEHFETVRRRKDGTHFDVSLTISPVKDAHGRIVGASKIARDVSEKRRAREALQQAHDALERRVEERTAALTDALAQMESFAYAVSHDLRAPLRAMVGYAELLREDHGAELGAEARRAVEKVISLGGRMSALITDVLAFARVNQGQIVLVPTSVADCIDGVVQYSPELQPPRCEIVIDRELPDVLGNATFLTHVFANLLGNAAKFVRPGTLPRIKISAERRGDFVRFAVADNGIGIKPDQQSRLFGLFERLGADQRYTGTGMGLAIVRRAIQRMGGSVIAESDGENGSVFIVTLRAAVSPTAGTTMPS